MKHNYIQKLSDCSKTYNPFQKLFILKSQNSVESVLDNSLHIYKKGKSFVNDLFCFQFFKLSSIKLYCVRQNRMSIRKQSFRSFDWCCFPLESMNSIDQNEFGIIFILYAENLNHFYSFHNMNRLQDLLILK